VSKQLDGSRKHLGLIPLGSWSLSGRIRLELGTLLRRLVFRLDGEPFAFPWRGTFEEQESLLRLFDYIDTVRVLHSPDWRGTIDGAAVRLYGENRGPVVRGRKKPKLNPTQYLVVKALVDAGLIGLSKRSLECGGTWSGSCARDARAQRRR